MRYISILALVVSVALTACGKSDHTSGIPNQNQTYQGQVQPQGQASVQQSPAQAPIIVQQESNSVMPALLGAAAGYMLGSAGNSRQPERQVETRVVERRVYVPAPAPAVVPKPSAPATPAFTAPKAPVVATPAPSAPKPSYSSGGYASVKQSAPSYSSRPSSSYSSSSSSRSSGRR